MVEVCRTKIAGVCSGPDADQRQCMLSFMADGFGWKWTRKPFLEVSLVPEPENEYDPDAIAVWVDVPMDGERFKLGYVKNSETVCSACGEQFERNPGSICPICRRMGTLERFGTATRLSQLLRQGVTLKAVISEITGGHDGKAFGGNLIIYREPTPEGRETT